MLRSSLFHPKSNRSVHVNAPAWKLSWLPLMTRKEFREAFAWEKGSFTVPSCSPASSVTASISQERLCSAPLTNKSDISVTYPREVYFLLMLHAPLWVCRGVLLMVDTWGLLDPCFSLLSWLGERRQQTNHSLALEASTWKWDLLRFCSAVIGRSKSRGEVQLDSSRVSGRERAGNICGTNTNDSSSLLSVHRMFGLLSPPTLPTPGRISSFSPVRGGQS